MHIAIVGPIAGEDVREYLGGGVERLPIGYLGAPLTGIMIGELLRLGNSVTAITTDSALSLSDSPVQLLGERFKLIVCPARPRAWRNNGKYPGRALDLFSFERRQVANQLKVAAPDIVHAHWTYEFALAALASTTPHLITCHDAPGVVLRFTRSPYRALRYLMARRVFRHGREFSTVSDYMARELAPALGYYPCVIPNPIAPYVMMRGGVRAHPETRRVAVVCNGWDRRKNPEIALRAFAKYRSTEPLAQLHMFGASFGVGEYAEKWAKKNGLADNVHFLGRLPHRELINVLSGMDVLLHTSLEESFGVVIAEAMALGLPVVAGDKSGAVPWVMGADAAGCISTGVLVNVLSIDAVSGGLKKAFDERYSMRSASAVSRARNTFAPHAVAQAYISRYRNILKISDDGSPSQPATPQELSL
ncbi:glycosyltransferase family 4 protein [Sphaerotilus mobilis]|uniref:Glycosyltransferase involved in cell wall biosynthesis n=1 Tax=Sphaerotilus mobilis TaxID=47994 RepID=A0A4Q7LW15_9BURK|nr:glycosyltransferase family 4 protein [Sphaerotilus mobilis]RZS58198.1 glycosyltransferase involved in cell wall biosynthesis [Sphaerotilus mobilis]